MLEQIKQEFIEYLAEDYEEEQIEEACEIFGSKYDIHCDYYHVGGFDSTGYDAEYYAVVLVDKDRNVDVLGLMTESY